MIVLNEKELEKMLPGSLLLAAAKRYDEIPDTEPIMTKKYQRKFEKMLVDPFKYAKKYNKSLGKQIRHYALVAALILAILTGTIFAIPPTRSIAVDLIRQWFEDHVTFSYNENSIDFVFSRIEIEYIPDGYKLIADGGIEVPGEYKIFEYKNFNNDILDIDIYIAGKDFTSSINTEFCDIKYVKLKNGIQAQLFQAYDDTRSSDLIWTSKDSKIFFAINGKLSQDELINIANGINLK